MKTKRLKIVNFALVAIAFLEGIWAYNKLPEKVASHWNAAGQVDGYTSRFGGAFFLPFLILGLYLLFLVIPLIDPKKRNITKFINIYYAFITTFLLFMLYLYSMTISYNLGNHFNFTLMIVPAFSLLFILIGIILPKIHPNWFIGIRTPWTISSDEVWQKTHILGGKLYIASGIISLAGLIFPRYAFWFFLAPIILASLYLVLFSYLEYRKIEK